MAATIDWWQHLPEHMDPVIFEIGSFRLQYYGLMYIVAFAITYGLAAYRLRSLHQSASWRWSQTRTLSALTLHSDRSGRQEFFQYSPSSIKNYK